jgi:hypothetical protein
VFKQAIGALYKQQLITIDKAGIKLNWRYIKAVWLTRGLFLAEG